MNLFSPARWLVGDLLLALVTLLTVDVVFVMRQRISAVVLKADYRELFRYELILCGGLLLFALDVRFNLFTCSGFTAMRVAGWAVRAVAGLLTLVTAFFCGRVIVGSRVNTSGPADHAIVLGLALENGQPTGDLLERLNTAQAYLEEYPQARLILTGGNADGSGRTEAAVMRDILSERGVAEERLMLEDKAKSTKDNFRNTAQFIDPAGPVVLISSDYHMDRAVRTAKGAGFSNILRLPARSSLLHFGANVLYEAILELNELTLKR